MAKAPQLLLVLVSLVWFCCTQNNLCSSNCLPGNCEISDPLKCTACSPGLLLVGNSCITNSLQPDPFTMFSKLTSSLQKTPTNENVINCQILAGLNQISTMSFAQINGVSYFTTFRLPFNPDYLQLRFNAVAITTSLNPRLQFSFFDQRSNIITNGSASPSFPSGNTNQLLCGSSTVNTRNFYFVVSENSNPNPVSAVSIEIRVPRVDSIILANIQLLHGRCHPSCGTCSGPNNNNCLNCRGLFRILTNRVCLSCPTGFYSNGDLCQECPPECLTCSFNSSLQRIVCLTCDETVNGGPASDPLTCKVSTAVVYSPSNSFFFSSTGGWTSSQTTKDPISSCGPYSLIGGPSIGTANSVLRKTFTNLNAHNTVWLRFTMFLIDQDSSNEFKYQIYIDGVLIDESLTKISVAPSGNGRLTNECETAGLESATRVIFDNISHTSDTLNFTLLGLQSYFGIRAFTLGITNSTTVEKCRVQLGKACVECRNGLQLVNQQCLTCPSGTYLNKDVCLPCPFGCKTCTFNSKQNTFECTSCEANIGVPQLACASQKDELYAIDTVARLRQLPNITWIAYPKLQTNAYDTCGPYQIVGSSSIKYRKLFLTRSFKDLPQHFGVTVAFEFLQIDDFDNSLYFTLDGKIFPYVPVKQRIQICGNSTPDAVKTVVLKINDHTASTLAIGIHAPSTMKFGFSNARYYLINCKNCSLSFDLEAIPTYVSETNQFRGYRSQIIFSSPIKNETELHNIFGIKIGQNLLNSTARLLQQAPITKISNPMLSISQKNTLEIQIPINNSKHAKEIMFSPTAYDGFFSTDSMPKPMSKNPRISPLPRFVDMDAISSAQTFSIRNIRNLFYGCAIVGLWIGLLSFFVGLSPALDDFFVLCQIVFAHAFIMLPDSPPSWRVPMSGFSLVQFMSWLPTVAQNSIQDGIIPSNLVQYTPLVFKQFGKDIVFARNIYHTILFLFGSLVLLLLLKVTKSASEKLKIATAYIRRYIYDYHERVHSYTDMVVRYSYFTVIWASALQLNAFSNSPNSFNIWNSVLLIFMLAVYLLYPIVMFILLNRASDIMTYATFKVPFYEMRIDQDKLYHFLFRYYRLAFIAFIIGLGYKSNPISILIPLIIVNIADVALILILKPFGLYQPFLLSVIMYPHYPVAYTYMTAIQSGLLVVLEIIQLIMYGQKDTSSDDDYVNIGFACCAIVILLVFNGMLRAVWGLIKSVEACWSGSQAMELQVKANSTDPQDEQNPILAGMTTDGNPRQNTVASTINDISARKPSIRLPTMRRSTIVSRIA